MARSILKAKPNKHGISREDLFGCLPLPIDRDRNEIGPSPEVSKEGEKVKGAEQEKSAIGEIPGEMHHGATRLKVMAQHHGLAFHAPGPLTVSQRSANPFRGLNTQTVAGCPLMLPF